MQFVILADVARHSNNLAAVIFFQPRNNDRGIQAAGVRQNNFVHFLFHIFSPLLLLTLGPPAVATTPRTVTNIAFSTGKRLAACWKTNEYSDSMTESVTSCPRCAGKQCINTVVLPVFAISSSLT